MQIKTHKIFVGRFKPLQFKQQTQIWEHEHVLKMNYRQVIFYFYKYICFDTILKFDLDIITWFNSYIINFLMLSVSLIRSIIRSYLIKCKTVNISFIQL